MEKTNFFIESLKRLSVGSMVFLLLIFILYNCAGVKPQFSVSQYRFSIDDKVYRIRSISSQDESISYNEVLGEYFLAVDFDQDRIIDRVTIGDAKLNTVQEIYEYGLDMLTQENKLQEKVPGNNKYTHETPDLLLEIKSFHPTDAQPFNEFKIIEKPQTVKPQIVVTIDHDADGKLDDVLKGGITLDEIQARYREAINTGLQKGKLVKVDDKILVKKR